MRKELREKLATRAAMNGVVDTEGIAKFFCSECSTYLLEIRDDNLIIKAKHFGENHVTVIPLSLLPHRDQVALPNGLVLEV